MKVSIGRIVRYVPDSRVDSAAEYPAIVTAVHQDETAVDLQVFRRSDILPALAVPFLAPETLESHGHTWHWPERG